MSAQIGFDPDVDYYKALGVPSTASADDIKKAYRKLAKLNHPDSTGGDKAKESRFKEQSTAYDVLGDAKKRQEYDNVRAHIASGLPRAGGPGFSGFGGGFPGYAAHGPAGSAGEVFDLGDLFSQFFPNGQGGKSASGPSSARVRVDTTHGGPRRRPEPEPERQTRVKASDGTWLRVDGGDVHSDARVSFDRAILGTIASVATIDGTADVKIPPGTSSGRKLRLKGKGVPAPGGGVGDHYVTVQIDVPGNLDDDAKKQLVQLVTRLGKQRPD